jgi:hypothetical protein
MPIISLKAHFDGKHIRLDEPFELPLDAQLLVTVLTPSASDQERADWLELSIQGLERAYGDNEPDYSTAEILP